MGPRSRFPSLRAVAFASLASAAFLACAAAETSGKKKRTPVEPGAEFYEGDFPVEEELAPTNVEDSGAFGVNSRPSDKDGGDDVDASVDAGPVVKCTGPLAAGDLVIVELMIAARAGTGDDGEWIEVRSTRDCALHLGGLSVESPRGNVTNIARAPATLELEPLGTFVVAGSTDPAKNHGLQGNVFAWSATDVLKNDGDTLTLKAGGVVIDRLSYPRLTNLEVGRTLAFPADCPGSMRADWTRWSLTFANWKPGTTLRGTPNANNDDITCF